MLSFICFSTFIFMYVYLLRIKYLSASELVLDWIDANNYALEEPADKSYEVDVLCWPIKARAIAINSIGEKFEILFSIKVYAGISVKRELIKVKVNNLKNGPINIF